MRLLAAVRWLDTVWSEEGGVSVTCVCVCVCVDAPVHGLLGDVLTDLGLYQEAGEYYDKCLAMDD